MAGRVVLLNGVGSAGKSSIARALQSIAARPLLHVQMDAFLDMLPDALHDHADGFRYIVGEIDGHVSVAIEAGPAGERLLEGMRWATRAMAEQGNDLIVDEVLLGDSAARYREALSGLRVHWIGVFAPLDVLEARERERGDRMIGLARWQFDRVHRGVAYDLEIDTSWQTPEQCARLVAERFGL